MSQIIYEERYPQETPEEPAYAPEGWKVPDMSFVEFMRREYENRFSIPIPDRENGGITYQGGCRYKKTGHDHHPGAFEDEEEQRAYASMRECE